MKKIIIVSAVLVVALVTLGVAGFAFAQTDTPTTPETEYGPNHPDGVYQGAGPGLMNGRGAQGAGRGGYGMGGFGIRAADGSGPLHEYLIDAFAAAFNMDPAELEALHADGTTLWEIAQDNGMDAETFQSLMSDARSQALAQAVADGALTQEQADFMGQRWNQGWPEGYGPGSDNCDGSGSQGGRMGRGMRFQQQQ
jgi:hypothetical protein